MTRGEVGARPLMLDIIKRVISYINNIKTRTHTIAYSAYDFEIGNNTIPNFSNKFDLIDQNIYKLEKKKVTGICLQNYDRRWVIDIMESPKAISYVLFKKTVFFEKYLYEIKNMKHKIALSRFRLSNHNLLIEKRRYFRPTIEQNNMKYFLC